MCWEWKLHPAWPDFSFLFFSILTDSSLNSLSIKCIIGFGSSAAPSLSEVPCFKSQSCGGNVNPKSCAESRVFKSLDFTQDQRRISRLNLNCAVQVTQFWSSIPSGTHQICVVNMWSGEKSSAYVEINQKGAEYLTAETDQIFSDTVTCMSFEKKKTDGCSFAPWFYNGFFFLLLQPTTDSTLEDLQKDDKYTHTVSHDLPW